MEIGVRLTVVGSQGESDVICSLLRANGIECGERPAPEVFHYPYGEYAGPREILVREADLDVARELIAGSEP